MSQLAEDLKAAKAEFMASFPFRTVTGAIKRSIPSRKRRDKAAKAFGKFNNKPYTYERYLYAFESAIAAAEHTPTQERAE